MGNSILAHMDSAPNAKANDLAKKTTLLDAIHLLVASWEKVESSTVANCFQRAVRRNQEPTTPHNLEITKLPEGLQKKDFEAWIDVDVNVKTDVGINDEDICEMVIPKKAAGNESDCSDDDNDAKAKIPTAGEMRQALKVLRRGVQSRSTEFRRHYAYEEFIENLLEGERRQTSMLDFFSQN